MYRETDMALQIIKRQQDKKTLKDGLNEIRDALSAYVSGFFDYQQCDVVIHSNEAELVAELKKGSRMFNLKVNLVYSETKVIDVAFRSFVDNSTFLQMTPQTFTEVEDAVQAIDGFVDLFCDSLAKRFANWSN